MSQIKSKLRVKELAEVYTNEREVNAMLDLVKDYSYDISKRFLEPACGNGNFLIKILERKLASVDKLYSKSSLQEFEYRICVALTNIYAVDICPENVKESQERLLHKIFDFFYLSRNTEFPSQNLEKTLRYILKKTIICGNTLEDMDMVFTEFLKGKEKHCFIQQRYRFISLFNEEPKPMRKINIYKHYLKLGV